MASDVTMEQGPPGRGRISDLLRRRSERILEEWSARVRREYAAGLLREEMLRDHVPEILESLAECIERGDPSTYRLGQLPELHALERLHAGIEIEAVAREYALLRRVILDVWGEEEELVVDRRLTDVKALDRCIDLAITAAVARYAEASERTLRALDELATAAFRHVGGDTNVFLRKLLESLDETIPLVDTAVVYLREDESLVVRAGLGPAQAYALGTRLDPGECLPGIAALQRAPIESTDAQNDERITSLDRSRVRAAYAVPLIIEEQVIGAVVVASQAAASFSPEDMLIVRALAALAAATLALASSYREHERAVDRERALVHQLEEAVQLRESLVSIVSHDLRNPLNAITLSAMMLMRRDDLDDSAVKTATRIYTSADRALRMIRDLLDLHQARSGGIPLQMRPVDLHATFRQVVEEVRLNYPDRHVDVIIKGDGTCDADADRLAQVITNIVGNALQHSPPGTTVEADAGGEGDHLVWEVRNEGEPIPVDILPHLFEPHRHWRGEHSGLGLGLKIAKAIVDAHGGTIDVASSMEAGTRVRIVLPRHRGADAAPGPEMRP